MRCENRRPKERIRTSVETRNPADAKKANQEAVRKQQQLKTDMDRVCKVAHKFLDGETQTKIAEAAQLPNRRCRTVLHALEDTGEWQRFNVQKSNRKKPYPGWQGSRVIPIFPEVRPYLEAAFDTAPDGAVHVIRRYRKKNSNLRTQLGKIIHRAGLEMWPKLFQNLRSTRETELAEDFPMHVVCDWIGNTKAVAAKHYLQVTNDHFKKATQNATQSVHATRCPGEKRKPETQQFSLSDKQCQEQSKQKVVTVGPETPSVFACETSLRDMCRANCTALA